MPRLEANIPGTGLCRVDYDDGFITAVRRLGEEHPDAPCLSPGFFDTQLNGFAGTHFSDPGLTDADLERLLQAVWATGTTSFCPTLISNTPEALQSGFARLEAARERLPGFAASAPCYHLEGPYLSSGVSAGAHKAEFMKDPDWEEFATLNKAAGNRIRLVTIAPEREGAAAFTHKAVEHGIRIALSHTDGSPEDVHRLAAAGATSSTHLGNGCPQVLDRHRAPFWAQLADDRLLAGLICDGFHLTREMVQIITRVKGVSRCLLVSDAVFVAGLPPGPYELVGKPIELLESGQVVTANRSSMAGSTLHMADAVGNFMEMTGLPLVEALLPATRIPADYLGPPGICREITVGQPANLVLFTLENNRLTVQRTLLKGRIVFERQ